MKTAVDLINRIISGDSVDEIVDELTTTSTIPMRPPRSMGMICKDRKYKPAKEKGQGKLPYIGYREPNSSPGSSYYRSYEEDTKLRCSYTGGYSGVSGVLAVSTRAKEPFSGQDLLGSPWKRALRRKRYRGLNVGFGKSKAMGEAQTKGIIRKAKEVSGTEWRLPYTLFKQGFMGWEPIGRYKSETAAVQAANRRNMKIVKEK